MTESSQSDTNDLSSRSRPKVAGFMPILKHVDSLNEAAAHIDVDMAMGENWLVREPLIAVCKKAMVENLAEQDLSYSHGMGGTAPLLDAFATFFNRFFSPQLPVTPQHVITTAGASTCLDALLYAICDEGDSIIVPSPFWGGYMAFTKIRSDVNVIPTKTLPFRSATSLDVVAAVKEAYDSAPEPKHIKALLITNPHNPVPGFYSPSTLRELMAFCKEKGLQYISDEVFALSAFGEEADDKFTSALTFVNDDATSPMDSRKVHVIYSMSKDFGSAGLRTGCLVSRNRPVLEGCMLASYLQTSILNSIFVTALLTSSSLSSIIQDSRAQLKRNYHLLTEALEKWGIQYIPTRSGFMLFAKLAKSATTWEEEEAVVKKLLAAGVMMAPGKGVGGIDGEIGWVRMSFCIPEVKLRDGIERIGKTLGLEQSS